jgi:two-component system LytT family response regulator
MDVPQKLRVVIADDERPARLFLEALLRGYDDVEVLGSASNGTEAVALIEQHSPDLALLDLQMPELDGLGVVRVVRKKFMPLFAFVTAFDEYAVAAFDMNAIDYLLKPIEPARLRHTLSRAQERLENADFRADDAARVRAIANDAEKVFGQTGFLRRIPVRRRDDIVIVSIDEVAAIIADGELLHLTTLHGARHTITYRLKDLEARLDPARFVRLSRGALVAIDQIEKVSPMPGATYVVTLRNKLQIPVSRMRARVIREELLRL